MRSNGSTDFYCQKERDAEGKKNLSVTQLAANVIGIWYLQRIRRVHNQYRLDGFSTVSVIGGLVDVFEIVELNHLVIGEPSLLVQFHQSREEHVGYLNK
jgi:hypothetical protein